MDIKGEFYNDICTPFFSSKDTDVILNDRVIYYYSKISSDTTCPINCQLLNYLSENNKLKCSCEISTSSINTQNSASANTYISNDNSKYLNDYKYSSYKTMKCINLVFNSEIFGKNAGAILSTILLAGYVTFMGLYFFKNISPLKVDISKILSENNNNINKEFNLFDMTKNKNIQKKKNEGKKAENKDKEKKINKINKKSNPPKKIQNNNQSKPKKLFLRGDKNINNNENYNTFYNINNSSDFIKMERENKIKI